MVNLMDRKDWDTMANDDKLHIVPGHWYYFDDDDLEIAIYWGSLGKQAVFINGDLVHSQRSIGYNSWVKFTHGDDNYEIIFIGTKFITGENECLLLKNNEIVDRTAKAYTKNAKKVLYWAAGLGFIAGFSGVFTLAKFF